MEEEWREKGPVLAVFGVLGVAVDVARGERS